MRVIFALCIVSLALYCQAACPFSGAEENDIDPAIGCPHSLQAAVKPEITFEGCQCKSQCGASVGRNASRCDWCRTAGNCGKPAIGGRYGNCKLGADDAYEAQTWQSKMKYLWGNVDANHNSQKLPNTAGIFLESVQTSFSAVRDEFPEGRKKYIHAIGAVCRFSMTMEKSSPYSGLFESGEQTKGLIRMGSATPVTLDSGVTPGVGVKFLRSGRKSGNYVALDKVEPMDDLEYNFFAVNLSNIIPPAVGVAQKLLAKKFEQASQCSARVGLSDMCKYNTAGKEAKNLKFPYQLVMVPGVSIPSRPVDQDRLQRNLAAIPAGSTLYKIMHRSSPGASVELLGNMVMDGKCVNSLWGDEKLFFQHQRIEDDWALNTKFFPSDAESSCGRKKLSMHPPPGCAF